MTQLNRFQMAAVKRTAQNTKKLVTTKGKIVEKIKELAEQLEVINQQINAWEEPIKVMTGGYTSEQIIAFNGVIPEGESQVSNISEEDIAEESHMIEDPNFNEYNN